MAKLKITDIAGDPIPEAYINFVKNLFEEPGNFAAYKALPKPQRPERIQELVRSGPDGDLAWTVTQEISTGATEAIDNSNCKINGDPDERRTPGQGPSKVTVPIPPNNPAETTLGIDYLNKYAKIVHDLYDQDQGKATRFLLGIMLLTRCR